MKKLIFIAFLFIGCNTVEPETNYQSVEGYIIYSKTFDGFRSFEVYQSNLNEDVISISVNELPFEPIRMQLFWFEGECKKYTNTCTVDKIIGVSNKYPN